MKRLGVSDLDQQTRDKIVHEWRTRKLNSIAAIAKDFNMSYHVINKIINEYLSPKNKLL
ncbi:hypothetical protein [Flavobacterium anhuiense]|uniref:hypothetical protein n=1 Tax=Flavobacterium anhuiense TaxID=459526 RepID=UPI0013C50A34|nr:hypothetical protein [Flavobacterium anhuiense]